MCELTFVSSFIFRRKVGFLNSRLILGAKQQVVLIYRDFISWQECFRVAALYLLPPAPGHVGIPSSVVLMSERQLMFSIKDAVSWREKGWETSTAGNKRKADEITVSSRSPTSKAQVLLAGSEGRRPEPRHDTNHAVRQRSAAGHLNRMMQRQENCRLSLQKSYPAKVDAGFV